MAAASQGVLAANIMAMLTPEMREHVRVWTTPLSDVQISQAARIQRASAETAKLSTAVLYNVRRALLHHLRSTSENGMVAYPTSEDVVIEALEVYREDALERGAEAARNLANEKRGAFGSSVGADQATWLPNAEVDGAIFILAVMRAERTV